MGLVVHDMGRVPYAQALEFQLSLLSRKLNGEADDHLLLVEHDPVYTLGRGACEDDLQGAHRTLGVPAYRVGRGGGVTYHGPGQLVAYPILSLASCGRDVRLYVRALERVIIECCAVFQVRAGRAEGLPGVWVGDRKLGSIGIGIRRWTTFHGISLNVTSDLRFFEAVVPCRVRGMKVSSLERELAECPSLRQVAEAFEHCFRRVLAPGSIERNVA